jgi:putative hemolysin
MFFLLMLSAFFSGSETALFSLRPEQVRQMKKDPRIKKLLSMLESRPSDMLTGILFGNLIINILFFCSGAVMAGRWAEQRGEWAEALGGAVILTTVIVFGELLPKALGVTHAERVVRFTFAPLTLWLRLTRGVSRIVRHVLAALHLIEMNDQPAALTRDELAEMVNAVREETDFGVTEKAVMEDIMNLSDVRVRQIMVPRVEVLRYPVDADYNEICRKACEQEISRVLIYQDHDENPLGYVPVRKLAFLSQKKSLETLIEPLVYVPEVQRADRLLEIFIEQRLALAAVVDEYGGLAGIITIEDLFEELVGEMDSTEHKLIAQLSDTSYRLSGRLCIRTWRNLFRGHLAGYESEAFCSDTLGGFVIAVLGRIPEAGDVIHISNLSITVESVCQSRVDTLLLELKEKGGMV